ncbi:glycosyltransferase family 4 protein [Roseomonas marmotae]|uniref:Glycosyltransferase family 4 protein n=2 Tax=Roseomonas marmotae TaxID=2768161 RepID=A0ABS3KBT1_9PROT|nr:glycosyltransferase family 4 protein [Roseomonas marmotae]QTI80821.1 glycosyltransferase family 4 protein [Roseomonas marmotae]
MARPDVSLALSLSREGDLAPAFQALGLPCDLVPTYRGAPGFLLGFARLPGLARRLVRQARRFGADLVLSAMPHLWTPLVAPALARAGIPYVPILHDALPHPGDPGLAWDWRLGRDLAAARGAVVLSATVERVIRARAPGLPLFRLPLGAHLPAPPPTDARPGHDFLFFGRIRAYKGLDLLRDAMIHLHRTHPGATLRVVGQGDIEAAAPGLSALTGVTVEPRWVADEAIPALVASARSVVLPYREASQSGVLPIALACGVPVVAMPVGGLAEQLRDGGNGLLARDATPGGLAEAMARMMDPALRARLAEGARRDGEALMDWSGQAGTLLEGIRPWLRRA